MASSSAPSGPSTEGSGDGMARPAVAAEHRGTVHHLVGEAGHLLGEAEFGGVDLLPGEGPIQHRDGGAERAEVFIGPHEHAPVRVPLALVGVALGRAGGRDDLVALGVVEVPPMTGFATMRWSATAVPPPSRLGVAAAAVAGSLAPGPRCTR